MDFIWSQTRAATDAVVMCSDGLQQQFIPVCLTVRDEVGLHLAQCVVQALNHFVGLCVTAAGESGPLSLREV